MFLSEKNKQKIYIGRWSERERERERITNKFSRLSRDSRETVKYTKCHSKNVNEFRWKSVWVDVCFDSFVMRTNTRSTFDISTIERMRMEKQLNKIISNWLFVEKGEQEKIDSFSIVLSIDGINAMNKTKKKTDWQMTTLIQFVPHVINKFGKGSTECDSMFVFLSFICEFYARTNSSMPSSED